MLPQTWTQGLAGLQSLRKTGTSDQITAPPGTKLCDRCAAINLPRVVKVLSQQIKDEYKPGQKPPNHLIYRISTLGSSDTWKPNDCALCFLFEVVRQQSAVIYPRLIESSTAYLLGAIPLRLLVSRDAESAYDHLTGNENVALAVYSDGFMSVALAGALPLITPSARLWQVRDCLGTHSCVLKPQFDAALVRKWLVFCQRLANHYKCRTEETANGAFMPARLVDCHTMTIIETKPAVTYRYVALSYVWGPSSSAAEPAVNAVDAAKSHELPSDVPKVITDAMAVARSLNIKYLWVDRYCINQDDEVQKDRQIKQMHRIFSGALLTIVAASGSSASCGLRGTSATPRSQSVQAKAGSLSLHIIPPDPAETVDNSAWATRGWTYQEMVLSVRRLYFTPTEVYYECRRWRYREAIDEPQAYLPDSATRWRDLPSNSHVGEIDHYRRPPKSWFHHIETYSRRTLTYESDAFSAFRGILSYYETLDEPWYHVWGLIMGGTAKAQEFLRGYVTVADCSPLKYLARSLAWTHPRELTTDSKLGWHRVPSLPSWSWLGWTGAKSMALCHFDPRSERNCKVQEAHVEMVDGTSRPIQSAEDAKMFTQSAPQLSNVLMLKAPVVSVRQISNWSPPVEQDEIWSLERDTSVDKIQFEVLLSPTDEPLLVHEDASFNSSVLSCIYTLKPDTQCQAIILGAGLYDDDSSRENYPMFLQQLRLLMIEMVQPDLWERIGFMIVHLKAPTILSELQFNVQEIRLR